MTRKLILLGLVVASQPALAGGFEAKTSRETLAAREVERPLILGKGWLEFGLGTDVKVATGEWSPAGEPVDWTDTTWLYTTESVRVRYGITRRDELYWDFNTHYVKLTNGNTDEPLTDFGLGDPHFGYRYEVFRSRAPLTSIVVLADYKAPLGNEAPGNYVGGPYTFSRVVMSTGTPDVTLGVRGKRQFGPVALTLGAAYVRRFSGIAQWAIETEYNQFNARVKPGDERVVDGSLLVQLGPVALDGGAVLRTRDAFKYGNSVEGPQPGAELKTWEGSDGWSLDSVFGLTFNATRGVDLVLGARVPLRGEDLQFWPLEDVQPTRGNTYSGTVEFRY